MLAEIRSLWIGGALSRLERVCLNSFLRAGHKVFLYTVSTRGRKLDPVSSEAPYKQRSITPLTLVEYQKCSSTRNEAIITAYKSGGYTMKQIGNHFNVHYSLVSRIVAASKK
ncbi:hypothetical protein MTCD1_02583 [Colwellia marinimaniae]|uniref:Resolvase HTH domain-containing protein n=1 Tax=Colwellia marinimaniae TaxID=1513592 RepID=A0ABQ0MX73_9GAMM|nr:hypothetical protein MTCD1_02583 [Colwellia marinimaniae]